MLDFFGIILVNEVIINTKTKNMKKLLSLLILPSLIFFNANAQNNDLVIFAEEATPFYLVMNGIKQNETAETNVKIPNINNDRVSVKVIFEDKSISPVSKNIWFSSMACKSFPATMWRHRS